MAEKYELSLLHYPQELLMIILSKLSNEENAKLRVVCKKIYIIGNTILERNFQSCCELYIQDEESIIKLTIRSKRYSNLYEHYKSLLETINSKLRIINTHFSDYTFYSGKIIDDLLENRSKTVKAILSPNSPEEAISKSVEEMNEFVFIFDYLASTALRHFVNKVAPNVPSIQICGIFFNSEEEKVAKKRIIDDVFTMYFNKKANFIANESVKDMKTELNLKNSKFDELTKEIDKLRPSSQENIVDEMKMDILCDQRCDVAAEINDLKGQIKDTEQKVKEDAIMNILADESDEAAKQNSQIEII